MNDELSALRAEVSALRTELESVRTEDGRRMSRRRLLSGLAGAGAATAVSVSSTAPAGAADGDPLVLGTENSSSEPTELTGATEGEIHEGLLTITQTHDGFAPAITALAESARVAVVAAGGGVGVFGTGAFYGLHGRSDGVAAVLGEGSDGAAGLWGSSPAGAGLHVEDSRVHAYLKPSELAGPPASAGEDLTGMLLIDGAADVWVCVAGGEPGTWTRLLREDEAAGRVVPTAPTRVLDTRATDGRPAGSPAVPGQKQGPLKGGETVILDLAGVGPIPANASGVVGNLTVTAPTYAGYLVAGPAGVSNETSALNFAKGATVANAFTSQLNATGLTLRASGTASQTYHLVVDITAYIT